MIINKRVFFDYFLLFCIISISGIPYFTTSNLFIPTFVILISTFLMRKRSFDKEFLYTMLFLTIIIILQAYEFEIFSLPNVVGIYLRVAIGYLIVKILNDKFLNYYVNILYYLAIVGTSVYLSLVVVPPLVSVFHSIVPLFDIFNLSGTKDETIIVYSINQFGSLRNSGPFWEPGAFGGYLIIAIIFTSFNKNLVNRKKKMMVFILALLTTVSTTAYSALAIYFFFYFYKSIKNIFIKILIVAIMSYGMYYAFFNIDFLGKKIELQLKMAQNAHVYGSDTNTQRFLNILRDVKDFKGHELVGRGFYPATRYVHKAERQIRTVGITDILVKMGLPFFILMIYFLYRSVCYVVSMKYEKSNKLYCFGSIVTILITLMSEVYFNFPLYWSLLFLFLLDKNKREYIG